VSLAARAVKFVGFMALLVATGYINIGLYVFMAGGPGPVLRALLAAGQFAIMYAIARVYYESRARRPR
jgi:hypothetical protein